jgi:uncharacterized glyoxalase superfamily protein PhnB
MKFGYTIVYVNDVESTMNFYSKAFKLEKGFIHESMQYGEMITGDTKLAFVSDSLSKSNDMIYIENNINNKPAGFEIAFITNEVQDSFNHAINNGALSVKEPIEKPWGQLVAYVRDINGILVEICSPIHGG